jgi:hypothetical protein
MSVSCLCSLTASFVEPCPVAGFCECCCHFPGYLCMVKHVWCCFILPIAALQLQSRILLVRVLLECGYLSFKSILGVAVCGAAMHPVMHRALQPL